MGIIMKYKNKIRKKNRTLSILGLLSGSVVVGILLMVAIVYGSGASITFHNGIVLQKEENEQQKVETPTKEPEQSNVVEEEKTESTPQENSDIEAIKAMFVSNTVLNSEEKYQEVRTIAIESEMNALVFDVKDSSGRIWFDLDVEEAEQLGAIVTNAKSSAVIKEAKEAGLYTIARITVFQDPMLAKKQVEKTQQGNAPTSWVNPYNADVCQYEMAIIQAAVKMGFDEIELESARFSKEEGYCSDNQDMSRNDAIYNFTKQAYEEVKKLGANLSASMYGTVLSSKVDADAFGQDVTRLSSVLDYICPTIYPESYATGSFGKQSPEQYPYEVITGAIEQAKEVLTNSAEDRKAGIRPWLQGYSTSAMNYDTTEVLEQIRALTNAELNSYGIYNASGNYKKDWFKY